MVKRNLIHVPDGVIPEGYPEEPTIIGFSPDRGCELAEGPWRSKVFSKLHHEGSTAYTEAGLGAEPERLTTWTEATKTWDRWRVSMLEFQTAVAWARQQSFPEDVKAGTLVSFKSKAGTQRQFDYGLYSGDNEESYMYRANAIWSNLDPLATDAELETCESFFRDIIQLRKKEEISKSDMRAGEPSESHKLSKQDKEYLGFVNEVFKSMSIEIAERFLKVTFNRALRGIEYHRSNRSTAVSSSQGATTTVNDDDDRDAESMTQRAESPVHESDVQTSSTARGEGKWQATVEDSAE